MTGVAKDTINDHVIAGTRYGDFVQAGKTASQLPVLLTSIRFDSSLVTNKLFELKINDRLNTIKLETGIYVRYMIGYL